jgi:hypothetical protein
MQKVLFTLISVGGAVAMFLAMVLCLQLGRRFAIKRVEKRGEAARTGVGVVDVAVYSLLSLLIGFVFSGAATRFDHRRELIVEEVGAISTAWQRIDVLPADRQGAIRDGVRRYLDIVIATYSYIPESTKERQGRSALALVTEDVWAKAVAACLHDSGEKARMLLLPALNEMFDAADRHRLIRLLHPPWIIWVMLVVTALAASMFGGYSMGTRQAHNWFHVIGFAATISIALYVIVEMEFPRVGIVQMGAMDRAFVALRATMK